LRRDARNGFIGDILTGKHGFDFEATIMLMNIKSAIAWPADLLAGYDALVSRLRPSLDGLVRGRAVSGFFRTERSVNYKGITLTFSCPSQVAAYRAHSFASKEPETLEWLDGLQGVFWDIGANVGLYSIYFAKRHNARAFAFEPSVFNLELLARNIHKNRVDVAIIPLALFGATKVDVLRMSTTEHAGALSSFGVDYGWEGTKLAVDFAYSTLGMSVDDAVRLGVAPPDHLKIDVDGVEHEILAGARNTLRSVASVLVELNDRFAEQAVTARKLLADAGLVRSNESPRHAGTHNEIWRRP
jgi:FkbM family methyltransferase